MKYNALYNEKRKELNSETFIKYYYSSLKNKNIIDALQSQHISKKELSELLDLTNEEIKQILSKYSTLTPDILVYLIISYAKLKAYQKTLKNKVSENYPQQLLDIIATNPQNARKNDIVYLIQNNILYPRKDIIEKLIKNKDENIFSTIDNYLECYKESSTNKEFSKIIVKYIELELEQKNNEKIYPLISEKIIMTTSKKPRAINAVLRQNSPQKMNQVMFAAANSGIYQNKKLFDLIQKQEETEKMINLRKIARFNRLRKYPNFLKWFATIDIEKQERLIKKIYEEEERQKMNRLIEEKQVKTDDSIENFKTNTLKSIKKLVKILQNPFQRPKK